MTTKAFLNIPVRDDAREFHSFERGPLILRALSGLGVNVHQKRVVDLGAGYGSLAIACMKAGAVDVLAVDINQERLDAIAARGLQQGVDVRTRRMNLLADWGEHGKADLAFVIGVVEYAGLWDDSAEVTDLQRKVLGTALDALKPGGCLVFASKNRLWPRFLLTDVHTGQPLVNVLPRSVADKLSRRLSGEAYRHHIHTPKKWKALIMSAGFASPQTYVPYLSYQFPLEITERASFPDICRVQRVTSGAEEWRVAWGRAGTIKAGIMAAAGTIGIQMGSALIATATKPISHK